MEVDQQVGIHEETSLFAAMVPLPANLTTDQQAGTAARMAMAVMAVDRQIRSESR